MHTILTALLDCDDEIRRTADTLLPQMQTGVKWVIKNSSMRSSPYLMELANDPNINIIYQADKSLYQGLNQGLEHCNTEFVQVIGAGDEFRPGSIKAILDAERQAENFDALFFGVMQKQNGRPIIPAPGEITKRMACPHPGTILRLERIKMIGGFDEKYRIASDYDLICRYLRAYPKCAFSAYLVIDYQGGGLSERAAVEGFLEEELIRIRVWSQTQHDTVINSFRFFKWASSELNLQNK